MSYDDDQEFSSQLRELPELPSGQPVEWTHTVRSPWVSGVFHEDRQDPNTTVNMTRWADIDADGPAALSYGIDINGTVNGRTYVVLGMDPQAAITLGRYLIAAGTTALLDQAKHAWFLSQPVTALSGPA